MSLQERTSIDRDLDARGLNCPLPVLKTRKAIKDMQTGNVLRVLSSDPGSINDIASFCSQTGNTLLASKEIDGAYEFLIRKN